jgi:hypothetical protein
MRAWMILAIVLAGCTGEETTDTDGTDTDVALACTALQSGAWTGAGAAFGMSMGVTLTADNDACTFTLTDWSMDMGDPDAGTVAGDQVTLSGPDAYWSTCAGTVNSDGTAIEGICTDDDAAFALDFGG